MRAAVDILREAGAVVQEVRLPHVHLSDTVGGLITSAEFAAIHEVHFDRLPELGVRYAQQELVDSQFVSATDYLGALRMLHLPQHDFEEIFEHVEVLVVPGMVGVAPPTETLEFTVNGERRPWIEVIARMTLLFNLVGIPALALPAGFSSDGSATWHPSCRPTAQRGHVCSRWRYLSALDGPPSRASSPSR